MTETETIEAEIEEKAALPAVIESPATDIVTFRKAVEFESERIELMQKFVASKMKKGTHFGIIPKTSKPTLFKAGAEVMCGVYKYGGRYEVKVTEDYAAVKVFDDYGKEKECKGFYEAQIRCTLFHVGSGQTVGEGLGSCNNWERKYLKKDVYEIKNTILKMAKKRAYVDATLSACRLSDFFTQDVEDMDDRDDTAKRFDAASEKQAQREHDRKTGANDPAGDAPADLMKRDMQEHCGGDFPRATRLMQLMGQFKAEMDKPKGWGAMTRDKWLAATNRRYQAHLKLCADKECPAKLEAIHKEQGWVAVD